MDTARYGTDKVRQWDTRRYKGESCSIDASLKEAAILLEDVDENVNLGARKEGCLYDWLEGRFYCSRQLEKSSIQK